MSLISSLSVNADIVQGSLFIACVSSDAASFTKISSVEGLQQISSNPSGNYVLTEDIDLSGVADWQPVCKTHATAFKGTFEGNGHIISGLSVHESFNSATIMAPSYSVGLFGVCDGAVIRNLGLENVDISINNTSGYEYASKLDANNTVFAGAIAGYAKNGTIIHNCYAMGTVQASASGEGNSPTIAGGLVGLGNGVSIEYSHNDCVISAYNANSTQAFDSYAGGLIGKNAGDGSIYVSYNAGNITAQTLDYGKPYAGGPIAYSSASSFEIADTYNAG